MNHQLPAIQSRLMTLRDESVFALSIRNAAVTDLKGCIKMILDQAKDNRVLVAKIIGENLLNDIELL